MELQWQVAFLVLTFSVVIVAHPIERNQNLKTANQFFRDNCVCAADYECKCCLQMANQDLCGNWTVISPNLEVRTSVNLNGAMLFTSTFSTRLIPPICYPLTPLPFFGCVKIHSVSLHNNNSVHACANVSLRFITFDFAEFLLGCIELSPNGIQVVPQEHTDTEGDTTSAVGEKIPATIDLIKQNSTTVSS